jgi:hypothetical protein
MHTKLKGKFLGFADVATKGYILHDGDEDKQPDDKQPEEKESEGDKKPEDKQPEPEPELDLKDPKIVALLEKVRKEEKNKLYTDLKTEKATAAQLAKEKAELAKQLEDAKHDATLTVEALNARIGDLGRNFEEMQVALKKRDLDLYKGQRLKEVGDDLIESLVAGNTEEEIDNSILFAQEEYQKITDKVKSKNGTSQLPGPTAPKQAPGVKQLTPQMIAAMTPKEYAERREEIHKTLGLM